MRPTSIAFLSFVSRIALASPTATLPLHSAAAAAAAESAGSAHASEQALGIAMESYAYPHPVQFLPLTIEGEDVRLAFMDVSPNAGSSAAANGKTVVLLHGKNFYGSYWENTIRALTSAGFRVVVPDQIGFGKSSKPHIAYSFDLLAAHTMQLLDHLAIDQAAIVGHSMGGMLAVRITRNHPARVTHLVLENPIGLEDYRLKVPPRSTEELYVQELKQTPAAFRRYVTAYHAHPRPELVEPFVAVRERISRSGEFPRWAMAAALTAQMIFQQPVRHEFSLIARPTLLVIGQEDRTAVGKSAAPPEVRDTLGNYPALGRAAAKDIPDARLAELPDVGHIPHLEAPEAFHRALLDFLR